jgi:hypothetical protein
MPRNRPPRRGGRFGGPADGRPMPTGVSAAPTTPPKPAPVGGSPTPKPSRPVPTGANGDFRRKRAQQLSQRLKALKGTPGAKRVQKKIGLNTKIDDLRSVEARTEEQSAQLSKLKDRYASVQQKSKANPIPTQKGEKPDAKKGDHESTPKSSAASALQGKLDALKASKPPRGKSKRGRRKPKVRASFSGASAE